MMSYTTFGKSTDQVAAVLLGCFRLHSLILQPVLRDRGSQN
jgi:hypothetical protein